MATKKINIIFILLLAAVFTQAQQAELSIQTGHTAAIMKLCYSPNGKMLASADIQNKIILWDMETGGQMVKFFIDNEQSKNSITALTFTKNGNYLVVGTQSGFVYIFDIAASKELNRYQFSNAIKSLTFCENNTTVYVLADKLFSLNIFDLTSKQISDQTFIHISGNENGTYRLINADGQIFSIDSSDTPAKQDHSLYDQNLIKKKKLRQKIIEKKIDKKIAATSKKKKKNRLELRKSYSSYYFYRTGITRAVFSNDGKNVFANVTNNKVKAFSLENGKSLFVRTSTYFDETFTSIAICNKYNLLFASNTDSKIYVINTETGKIKKYLKDHMSNVNDVAVSPDENYMASASTDRSIIIWNCKTLKPIRRLYTRAFSITSMDISNNGKKLVFADEIGDVKMIDLSSIMLDMTSVKAHNQPVPLISFTDNDSTFITAGNDNEIKLIDFNSSKILAKKTFKRYFQLNIMVYNILEKLGIYIPPKAQIDSMIFNNSGKSFSVYGGRFRKGKNTFVRFVSTFNSQTFKKINSQKTGRDKTKEYYSYNHYLNLNDTAKYRIDFYNKINGHTDKITGIKKIPGKSMVITSSLDATLKIWDTNTKKLLLTLIPVNKNQLIKLTAYNFYMAPKSALTAIGFKYGVNFFPPDQFDLQFNRPDIVLSKLGVASKELQKAYYQAYGKRLKKMGFSENMFENDYHLPEVSITDIDKIPLISTEPNISFSVNASDSKYNLNRINVWVNNVPVYGINGINLRSSHINSTKKDIAVNLSNGINKIQVSCLNEKGVESLKESFEITYQPSQIKKPDLYIVAIGASKYHDKQWDLTYAAKDATDFSELFQKQKNDYNNIYTTKILNQDVTVDNIRKTKQILKSSKVDDVVMIFYAGHGLLDDSLDYYLGTYNIDFNKPGNNGLKYEDLNTLLDSIPARNKILFIDACHSGEVDKESGQELLSQNVVENKDIVFRGVKPRGFNSISHISYNNSFDLMKELFADLRRGTGSVIVSSAGGGEYAFEGEKWKNGVFTYSLLNGIRSFAADKNKDHKITVSELQHYIMNNVQKLTNGQQKPTMRQENIDNNFVIWRK